MVVPAMIETTSVDDPTNGFKPGPASRNICGLSAITSVAMASTSLRCRIEPNALCDERIDVIGRIRLDHRDAVCIKPLRQPARQHRAAHLARAGEHDGALQIGERAGLFDDVITKLSTSSPRRRGPITPVFVVKREVCHKRRAKHRRWSVWVRPARGRRGVCCARREPTPRPRCRTSRRSSPRPRICRPRPRTGMPGNSARRRGWR